MKYRFFGKYGNWEEEHASKKDARLRAYALNVGFKEVV